MKNKYIKYILLFIIILQSVSFANAKEPVLVTDSILAETMLRAYTKLLFFEDVFYIKNYIEKKNGIDSYASLILTQTNLSTIGFGSWAEMPEYYFEKGEYKSPWKGYDIYTMKIPRGTEKNNHIVAKFIGNMDRNSLLFYPSNKIPLAYDANKNKIKQLDNGYRYFSQWKNDYEDFVKKNPNYKIVYSGTGYEKVPLYYPRNPKEIFAKLTSELMKNIYINRFINSGLVDSLTEGKFIKDGMELFPLLDSLIPDMDEELVMDIQFIQEKYHKHTDGYMYYYNFYYPGFDCLRKDSGNCRISRAWEKYITLQPETYTVAYNLTTGRTDFICGNGIFLSSIINYLDIKFWSSGIDHRTEREKWWDRKNAVYHRTFNLHSFTPGRFYNIASIDFMEEDEDYWYYNVYTEQPVRNMTEDEACSLQIDKGRQISIYSKMDRYPLWKKCTYWVSLSKQDEETVKVLDVMNCITEGTTTDNWWNYYLNEPYDDEAIYWEDEE